MPHHKEQGDQNFWLKKDRDNPDVEAPECLKLETPAKPGSGYNHNFCRNPDGDPNGIYCFTDANDGTRKYCDPLRPDGKVFSNLETEKPKDYDSWRKAPYQLELTNIKEERKTNFLVKDRANKLVMPLKFRGAVLRILCEDIGCKASANTAMKVTAVVGSYDRRPAVDSPPTTGVGECTVTFGKPADLDTPALVRRRVSLLNYIEGSGRILRRKLNKNYGKSSKIIFLDEF